jgi:hypothetical protein
MYDHIKTIENASFKQLSMPNSDIDLDIVMVPSLVASKSTRLIAPEFLKSAIF